MSRGYRRVHGAAPREIQRELARRAVPGYGVIRARGQGRMRGGRALGSQGHGGDGGGGAAHAQGQDIGDDISVGRPPAVILHADGIIHRLPAGDRAPGVAFLQKQIGLVDIGPRLIAVLGHIGRARALIDGVPAQPAAVGGPVVRGWRPPHPGAAVVGQAGHLDPEAELEHIGGIAGNRAGAAVVYGVEIPVQGSAAARVDYGGLGGAAERRRHRRVPADVDELGGAGHVLHAVGVQGVPYLGPPGHRLRGHRDPQRVFHHIAYGGGIGAGDGLGDGRPGDIMGDGRGGGFRLPARAVRARVVLRRGEVGEGGARAHSLIHLRLIGDGQGGAHGYGRLGGAPRHVYGQDSRPAVVGGDVIRGRGEGRAVQGHGGDGGGGAAHAQGQDIGDDVSVGRPPAVVLHADSISYRIPPADHAARGRHGRLGDAQVGLVDVGDLGLGLFLAVGLSRPLVGGVPAHPAFVHGSIVRARRPPQPGGAVVGEAGHLGAEAELENVRRVPGSARSRVDDGLERPGEGGPGRRAAVVLGGVGDASPEGGGGLGGAGYVAEAGGAGHVLYAVGAYDVHDLRPPSHRLRGHGHRELVVHHIAYGGGIGAADGLGDGQRVHLHRGGVGVVVIGVGGAVYLPARAVRARVVLHRGGVGEGGAGTHIAVHNRRIGDGEHMPRGYGRVHVAPPREVHGELARVPVPGYGVIRARGQGRRGG